MDIKTCTYCKRELPLTEFYPRRRKRADGTVIVSTMVMCKACNKQLVYEHNRTAKGKELARARAKRYAETHYEKVHEQRRRSYKKWLSNPENRAKYNKWRNDRFCERYHSDPEFREKVKARGREAYRRRKEQQEKHVVS